MPRTRPTIAEVRHLEGVANILRDEVTAARSRADEAAATSRINLGRAITAERQVGAEAELLVRVTTEREQARSIAMSASRAADIANAQLDRLRVDYDERVDDLNRARAAIEADAAIVNRQRILLDNAQRAHDAISTQVTDTGHRLDEITARYDSLAIVARDLLADRMGD